MTTSVVECRKLGVYPSCYGNAYVVVSTDECPEVLALCELAEKEGKTPVWVLTHGPRGHLDEIVAIAMVVSQFGFCVIVRTRDPGVVRRVEPKASYVIDVLGKDDGGKYNDHHQHWDVKVREDSGLPFASAGLVGRQIAHRFVHSVANRMGVPADCSEIAKRLDERILAAIDLVDVRPESDELPANVRPPRFPLEFSGPRSISRIPFPGDVDGNHSFALAVVTAEACLISEVESTLKPVQQRMIAAAGQVVDEVILVLPGEVSDRYVVERPNVLFAVVPRNDGKVGVICVRRNGEKIRFPRKWNGLVGADFEHATGIPGVDQLIHRGYGALTFTREAAIELCHLGLSMKRQAQLEALALAVSVSE